MSMTTSLSKLFALGAVVLVLGAGLCLFDDGGRPSHNLCTLSLAAAAGAPIALSLVVVGRPTPGLIETYRPFLADLPSPPPRA